MSKVINMSIVLSFGSYGGFYFHRGYSTRLCLGFVAVTFFPCDIDKVLSKLISVDKKEGDSHQ